MVVVVVVVVGGEGEGKEWNGEMGDKGERGEAVAGIGRKIAQGCRVWGTEPRERGARP
jgi:hypothetical protein